METDFTTALWSGGNLWLLVVGGGAVVLGVVFAYATMQWRTARQEETPAEKAEREVVTRENFGKTEQGKH
ncbi:hypothetical protein [Parvibaculum lavamentivorans]|uniref:hypothetical protein n=1 Tax=Parvibaculum lavamentivorans TaxID=256618 RepID=UPI0003092BD8|nr:hypothetical protein [Parvibaculum lavamentivorans]